MATLRLVSRCTRLHRSCRTFTSSTTDRPSSIRTYAYVTLFVLTAGVGAVYYSDSRAAVHRYVLTPLVRRALDAETGHKLAVRILESGLGPRDMLSDDERLKAEVYICASPPRDPDLHPHPQLWGQTLSNPIGLAAGFDKDGRAIDGACVDPHQVVS